MHVIEIDVIGVQPLQALFYFRHDVVACGATPVGAWRWPAHCASAYLGGDDHLVSVLLAQHLTDELLRLACTVCVCAVQEVDALFHSLVQHLLGGLEVNPATEIVGAQANSRYLQAGLAQTTVFHETLRVILFI